MATINEMVFFIQFIVFVCIILYKIYNVFKLGEAYEEPIIWIGFFAYLFSYGLGFSMFLIDASNTSLLTIFTLQSWLLALGFIIFVSELFIFYPRKLMGQTVEAYNHLRQAKMTNKNLNK